MSSLKPSTSRLIQRAKLNRGANPKLRKATAKNYKKIRQAGNAAGLRKNLSMFT